MMDVAVAVMRGSFGTVYVGSVICIVNTEFEMPDAHQWDGFRKYKCMRAGWVRNICEYPLTYWR